MIHNLALIVESLAGIALVCALLFALALLAVAPTAKQRVDDMVTRWQQAEQARDDATLAAGDEFRAWLAHPSQADPFAITRRQIAALKTIEDIA